jgi:hypothetical protein
MSFISGIYVFSLVSMIPAEPEFKGQMQLDLQGFARNLRLVRHRRTIRGYAREHLVRYAQR